MSEAVKVAQPVPDMAAQMIANQMAGGPANGLQMLREVDGFLVEQQWEALETITCGCYESQNEYRVNDRSGRVHLFTATERTPFLYRYCCGENRPFTFNIMDQSAKKPQKFAVMTRDFRLCSLAVCPCCLHHVKSYYAVDAAGNSVSARSYDTLIAKASTPFLGGCCKPTMNLYDRDDNFMGSVVGPFCCVFRFCGADFDVLDENGNKMGELKKLAVKNLKDVVVDLSTDVDNFLITIPPNVKPEMKMALLSVLLHLDFMFYEDDRSLTECKFCDLYCCGVRCAVCPVWCTCCCCYTTKEARREAEKRKEKGAPQADGMER